MYESKRGSAHRSGLSSSNTSSQHNRACAVQLMDAKTGSHVFTRLRKVIADECGQSLCFQHVKEFLAGLHRTEPRCWARLFYPS